MTKRPWETKPAAIWVLYLLCLLICPVALYQPAAEKHEKENSYIGIELGATHIRVATFRDGKIDILPEEQSSEFSPSYIAFTEDGILFGQAAKSRAEIDPRNSVFGLRNLIGRNFSEVAAETEHLPFKVISKADQPVIEIDLAGRIQHFSPEELFSLILGKMKETAGDYFEAEISTAVVTIPTSFNKKKREATKNAADLAGLDVPRLTMEPRAAGIAHEVDMIYDEGNYLVYHLDDETLSLHVVEVDTGVLEILSSSNDIILTGDARHTETQAFLSGSKMDKYGFGMSNVDRLDSSKVTLTAKDLFHRSLPSLDWALKSSNLTKQDIHDLIIVGQSSHIQKLQPLLEDYLGVKASHVVEPANSHVIGATIQAQILFAEEGGCHVDPMFWVCPLSLGIETAGGIMSKIIHRHTPVPVRRGEIFTTAVDNQTAVVIKVYQGERVMTRDNILLGKLELNVLPSPRGVPVIEVAMEIDANFILRVTARDLNSGMGETKIIHVDSTWSNFEMIEYLLMQSELLYQEDDVLRSLIQSTNTIDGFTSISD